MSDSILQQESSFYKEAKLSDYLFPQIIFLIVSINIMVIYIFTKSRKLVIEKTKEVVVLSNEPIEEFPKYKRHRQQI